MSDHQAMVKFLMDLYDVISLIFVYSYESVISTSRHLRTLEVTIDLSTFNYIKASEFLDIRGVSTHIGHHAF